MASPSGTNTDVDVASQPASVPPDTLPQPTSTSSTTGPCISLRDYLGIADQERAEEWQWTGKLTEEEFVRYHALMDMTVQQAMDLFEQQTIDFLAQNPSAQQEIDLLAQGITLGQPKAKAQPNHT